MPLFKNVFYKLWGKEIMKKIITNKGIKRRTVIKSAIAAGVGLSTPYFFVQAHASSDPKVMNMYNFDGSLGEFYTNFNTLNDRFVETWQGMTNERINFSAELRPGIMNYADNSQVRGEVQKQVTRITKIAENSKVKGQMDLESILEDMLMVTNQLMFHLTLK